MHLLALLPAARCNYPVNFERPYDTPLKLKMNEPLPESDEQLALKKRARRRLIGAIVFASFAAVVLPMVMDQEPPSATPTIELRIPAQDKGFMPPPTGVAKPAAGIAEPVPAVDPKLAADATVAKPEVQPKPAAELRPMAVTETRPAIKPETKFEAKAEAKSESKPAIKTDTKAVKAAEKAPPKAARAENPAPADAKRAQTILDGKLADGAAGSDGPHVVLIGAFANPANVQSLQKKLGEMGLRVYTEPLDSPQGKKTRVRVGPFPNREAAEKAAARMKSIGVSGVVAPKA